MARNRLNLNFQLESAADRNEYVQEYLKNITFTPNENELETTVYDVQTIFGEHVENINTVEDEYANKTIISKEFKYAIPNAAFNAFLMIDGNCVRQIRKDVPEIFVDSNTINAIDLGLSVLWADRNIGAASPHEVGKYFTYNEIPSSFDGSWRLPTKEECEELQQRLRQTGDYITDGHRTIPVPEKTITGRTGRTMTIPRSGYYVNSDKKTVIDENLGYLWSRTSESYRKRYVLRTDGQLFQYDEIFFLPVRLVCTKNDIIEPNVMQTVDNDKKPDNKEIIQSTVLRGVLKHNIDMLHQLMESAMKLNEKIDREGNN